MAVDGEHKRLITGAVIGQYRSELHAYPSVVSQRGYQCTYRIAACLVRPDRDLRHTAVIVDRYMHIVPAGAA